jgi:mannose-6-phosphate isomerase-like protein (cupin superfamily)
MADFVNLGPVKVSFVHTEPGSPYSLLEWEAPAGAASPPVHIHHRTDEGFYVLSGAFDFLQDQRTVRAEVGSHVLVARGQRHTFWNPGKETARCLIVLAPAGFEAYFRELAAGLANGYSDEVALQLRRELSAKYDIEVVGPPVQP